MEREQKFDRFIEDFDRTLNTDTSSFKTIGRPTSPDAPQSPTKGTQSPLLTTPTKARRNSISPADAPLSGFRHDITRAVEPSPKTMELRPSAGSSASSSAESTPQHPATTNINTLPQAPQQLDPHTGTGIKTVRLQGSNSSLKRSNTMGGISSVHRQPSMRRGLNLGLNLKRSGGTPQTSRTSNNGSSGLRSPEIITPTQDKAKRLSSPSTDSKVQPYGNQYTPVPSRLASAQNVHQQATHTQSHSYSSNVPSASGTSSNNSSAESRRDRRNTNTSVMSSEFDEVDDSLRVLAAKEMKVIELKHKLKLLQQEIETEELELKKLRDRVGNSIYKGISPQHNATKNALGQEQSTNKNTAKNDRSKRESIWSRPVSFLNQFDQLLQSEIERINKEGFKHPNEAAADKSQDASSSGGYSIWSFVNDVKHGLLGEDESPTRERSRQLNDIASDDEGEQEEMVTIRK